MSDTTEADVDPQAAAADTAQNEDNFDESADNLSEAIDELVAPDPMDLDEEEISAETEEQPAAEAKADGADEGEPQEGTDEPEAEAETEEPAEAAEAPEAEAEETKELEPEAAPETEEPVITAEPDQPQKEEAQTSEEVLKQHQEWYNETVDKLGEYYESEELVAEFGEDQARSIGKLQARVYLDAVQGATRAIMEQLPGVIKTLNSQSAADDATEKAFFDAWPLLNKKDHGDTIRRLANSYRQANPNAPMDVTITDVGAQAMVALKIPFEAPAETEEEAAANVPPVNTVSRGAPSTAKPGPTNPFDQLATEIEEEELESF